MKLFAPILFLSTALAAGLRAQAQSASSSGTPPTEPAMISVASVCGGNQTYDQLTADERNPVPVRVIPFGKSPIALTIRASQFSEKPVDAKTASSPGFCWWNTFWVGVDVSTAENSTASQMAEVKIAAEAGSSRGRNSPVFNR